MHNKSGRVLTGVILFTLGLVWTSISLLAADPVFVPISDTLVCEGDQLLMIIFADAGTPGDLLEFEMENAPQGVEFIEVPPG